MVSVESDVQADRLKSNCEISTRSRFSNTCSYVGIPSNAAAYLNTTSISTQVGGNRCKVQREIHKDQFMF